MLPKEYYKQIDLIKMTKQILGVKDPQVNYVLLSQSQAELMDKHISEIPEQFWLKEYQKPSWGRGLFVVNEDGFLKLIESNFDSSD